MSRPIPPSYKTRNWPAYSEPLGRHVFESCQRLRHRSERPLATANALKQRGSLTIWFDPDMAWVPPPTGKRGRQPQYSGKEDQETVRGTVSPTNAVQTRLTMKGEGRILL